MASACPFDAKCASVGALSTTLMFLLLSVFSPMASAGPFERNEYPSIDMRLLDWPLARRTITRAPYVQLDCYMQLDESFVDPRLLYRLSNAKQLTDRACLLRIPTGTRLTVVRMHTNSPKSYVTVLAGSSQVFMPLRTGRIYEGEKEMYGPWHVPCKQAYLVFNSRNAEPPEWIEFRLSAETALDRQQQTDAVEECKSAGAVNYAEMEYSSGDEEVGGGGGAAPEVEDWN